jgi:hypothetical protein
MNDAPVSTEQTLMAMIGGSIGRSLRLWFVCTLFVGETG